MGYHLSSKTDEPVRGLLSTGSDGYRRGVMTRHESTIGAVGADSVRDHSENLAPSLIGDAAAMSLVPVGNELARGSIR